MYANAKDDNSNIIININNKVTCKCRQGGLAEHATELALPEGLHGRDRYRDRDRDRDRYRDKDRDIDRDRYIEIKIEMEI